MCVWWDRLNGDNSKGCGQEWLSASPPRMGLHPFLVVQRAFHRQTASTTEAGNVTDHQAGRQGGSDEEALDPVLW